MANILIEGPLPDLPSASGIEILDTGAYIIGDDLPFLYQFDATTLTITVRIALFDAGTVFAAGPSSISPTWSPWPPSFGPTAGPSYCS